MERFDFLDFDAGPPVDPVRPYQALPASHLPRRQNSIAASWCPTPRAARERPGLRVPLRGGKR
jgi:hypothetical protein